MKNHDLLTINRNIENIYRTRIDGVDWFQAFKRGSGEHIPSIGNVRPRMHIARVTTLGTQLLFLSEQILEVIEVLGKGVEELIIVGEYQRLFLFPINDLVMAVLAPEKIGDVCFHTAWEVKNTDISIRPHLEPLTNREFAYQPKDIYNITRPYQFSARWKSIVKKILPALNQVHMLWLANDALMEASEESSIDDKDVCVNAVNKIGLVRKLAHELEIVLAEEGTPIGPISEIIIGRESHREYPKSSEDRGGSIVIKEKFNESEDYLTVISSDPMGKILFGLRHILPLMGSTSTKNGEALPVFDYGKADYIWHKHHSKLRNRALCQLMYDEEKLIWDTDHADSEIDALETPDVSGALLEEARQLSLHIPHVVGKLVRVEIEAEIGSEELTENTRIVLAPLGEHISCIAITQELLDEIRKQVFYATREFKASAWNIEQSTDIKASKIQFPLEFPSVSEDEPKGMFYLAREKVDIHRTPFVLIDLHEILIPKSKEVIGLDPIGELRGHINNFIERARIFVQFILHKHLQPWSVTLIGSDGVVYCGVYPEEEHHIFFVGVAKDTRPNKVQKWVTDAINNIVPEEGEKIIETSLNHIAQQIGRSECLFILGPELSTETGLPSPEEIVKVLIKELARQYDKETLAEAARCYEQRFGRIELIKALRGIIADAKIDLNKASGYKLLAKMPFKLLITSNFDSTLEEVLRKTGEEPQVIVEGKKLALLNEDQLSVLKIHGDLNNVDLVITTEDYLNYPREWKEFYEYLGAKEKNKTIVYIGFNPTESDFVWLEKNVRQDRSRYTHRAYVVTSKKIGRVKFAEWHSKEVTVITLHPTLFFERLSERLRISKFGAFITSVSTLLVLR